MRWVQHWIIGHNCRKGRRSLPYQLGCLLPDWFDRHPIHRTTESMEHVLDMAVRLRDCPPGPLRDWRLGVLSHFLCDYCTQAHNEEYYRFYRHRVYEVMAQKRILALRREDPEGLARIDRAEPPPPLPGRDAGDEVFRAAFRAFLLEELEHLHRAIRGLNSPCWYRDQRIMDLDIRWAHRLVWSMLWLFGEADRKNWEGADNGS